MRTNLTCAILLASAAVFTGACGSNSSSDRPAPSADFDNHGTSSGDPASPSGNAATESAGTDSTGSGKSGSGSSSATPSGTADPTISMGDRGSSSTGSGSPAFSTDGVAAGPSGEDSAAVVDAGIAKSDAGAALQAGSRLTAGLWDDNANYDVFLRYVEKSKTSFNTSLPLWTSAETAAVNVAYYQRRSFDAIDIALLLDTTGSMSDELSYLQSEFLGISREVTAQFPNTSVRWSLIAYRDQGDDYVTMPFDFTTDTEAFRKNLSERQANGGGDEPEAVATALQVTLSQSWRGADAAQMVLWVADAPHHDQDAQAVQTAISTARVRGIHIYPVASSNANPLAEATMRVAAQYTGGRYLFLTDDSGIGNSHAEPKVPCYYVTRFNDTITRSIAMEITGTYVAPSSQAIVRVTGTPDGAKCIVTATTDAGPDADTASDAQALAAQGDAQGNAPEASPTEAGL